MNGELNDIGFKRIPVVIKIMAPSKSVEQKINNPKYNVVFDWNCSCCIFFCDFDNFMYM